MQSVVLIIPASLRDRANELGEAMGWGPNNFSVNLGTHYGCHAWASEAFVAMLEIQTLQDGFDFEDVTDALIWSARAIEPETAHSHWLEVLTDNGLSVVVQEI